MCKYQQEEICDGKIGSHTVEVTTDDGKSRNVFVGRELCSCQAVDIAFQLYDTQGVFKLIIH